MQSSRFLRQAENANYLLETAAKRPSELKNNLPSSNPKWKSIHERLVDMYIEECGKQPRIPGLMPASKLLDKLVYRDKLNTLIINLYPGNDGYSLMLKGRNGTESESVKLPYEESELLEYVDNEELPPILVDLLEKSQVNIFYSGSVIAEIRDYRRTTSNTFDTRYVLLKPTPQTLLCDINTITNDGHRWTQEDKFNLESQLLLATQEPLCLDPSLSVCLVANRLQYEKHKMNTRPLKRAVKKFSQTAVNRKRKFAQCPAPSSLKLYDFLHKKKDKLRSNPPVNLKVGKPEKITGPHHSMCVDTWRQRPVNLAAPEQLEVEKLAKSIEKPKITLDNTPVTVEEYIMEMERTPGKIYYARLVVQQRLSDDFYLGELYVDRDFTEGQNNASCCKFSLGTKANVDKYIHQFTEIFTEEGRRAVKITHIISGQEPKVTFTQSSSQSSGQSSVTTTTQALLTQATSLAQNILGQADPSQSTDGSTKQPMKLSLQLNAPGSISSAGLLGSPSGMQSPVGINSVGLQPGNLQQTSNSNHRPKHMNLYSNISRSSSTPSPVSTPTSASAPLPGHHISSTRERHGSSREPNPTPPPPTGRAPTPNSTSSRRSSLTDSGGSLSGQMTLQAFQQGSNIAHFMQATGNSLQSSGSAPPTPVDTPTTPTPLAGLEAPAMSSSAPTPTASAPNINIANVAGLPQNISIQSLANLQGMGLTNIQGLQGLQNMQVSLTGVSMPGGGIAVPVPITMISSTNPSTQLLSTPAGIVFSSVAGLQGISTAGNNTGTSSTTTQAGNTTLVTMVTSMPQTTSAPTTATSGTPSSIVMTTNVLTNTAQVLNQGMLSVPIGMAGNLAQFMTAAGIKGTSQQIRPGSQLSLLQIPGQQPIQILGTNLPGQRTQVQPLQQGTVGRTISGNGSPLAAGSSGVLSPSNLTSTPAVTALSQLTSAVRGGGQPQTITAQQLMQLTPQQQQQLQQQQQQQQQQLQFLQKHQPQLQQFQLQQLKQQPGNQGHPSQRTLMSSMPSSKGKKRTTPTPPK
ncbi:transcription factor SPT20 homolog [Lingula anatina]|uniref:Transcription factor SPT20 homolog n=1 Tax=Lingula anatina TaxID=7574 RepID=A0A1S3I1W9_LINAN|nr:transcription factor SPT20 homolog [Lingula anatina]|eukprot:XP_013392262.1 transcription factor SPT20 homolog [Lingula anatina]